MKNKNTGGGPITIRRQTVEVFTGLSAAARRLGVSATQVKRHVSGEQTSLRLARRMLGARLRVKGNLLGV